MFRVEGWNLGQIVTQTQQKKKLKRKRDEKEDSKMPIKAESMNVSRKNPFSMTHQPASNNPRKLDDDPKLLKEAYIGLMKHGKESSKAVETSNARKKRTQTKNAKRAEKRRCKSLQSNDGTIKPQTVNKVTPTESPTPPKETKSTLTPLQQKMRAKLTGSQFRHINEKLYTTHSSEALSLFTTQPSLFHDVPFHPHPSL